MTLTARVSAIALTALAAAVFGSVACSDSNSPAPGTGDSDTGGTTATGQGGASTSDTSSGGTTETGSGGTTATGSGGATTTDSTAGGATTTTTTSTAGASACNYPTTSPPTPNNGAICDAIVKKGGSCTTEGAVCYKACGPTNSGWKSETCTNSVYVEVSACIWTATDYSAFKVPATLAELSTSCPGTAPQASTPCTVAPCIPCADSSTGGYLDSSGAQKAGWCECAAHDDTGTGKWTCGTAGSAWPCPGQAGC